MSHCTSQLERRLCGKFSYVSGSWPVMTSRQRDVSGAWLLMTSRQRDVSRRLMTSQQRDVGGAWPLMTSATTWRTYLRSVTLSHHVPGANCLLDAVNLVLVPAKDSVEASGGRYGGRRSGLSITWPDVGGVLGWLTS